MSLINYTKFVGYINIPNTNEEATSSLLDTEIERLEPIFLGKVFGYEFQKEMLANDTELRFLKILGGSEFTDTSGNLQKWEGLNTSLAYYVYYKFINGNLNGLTGIGYASGKSANADKVQPVVKPVDVYNQMVDKIEVLRAFLIANETDYEDDNLIFNNFDKVNSFGI